MAEARSKQPPDSKDSDKSSAPWLQILLALITVAGSIGAAYLTAGAKAESTAKDQAQITTRAVAPQAIDTALRMPVGSVISSMLTPDQMKEAGGVLTQNVSPKQIEEATWQVPPSGG